MILRGMYLDIDPREMAGYVEEIAEFSELGPYLDMLVRTYSSGMMVRLSFATSTCRSRDILLLDEWLAAGDAGFLAKAQERLEHFVGGSRILELASHSIPLLQQCAIARSCSITAVSPRPATWRNSRPNMHSLTGYVRSE